MWSATADVILDNSETEPYEQSHSGSWFAWLDGYGTPHTDTVAQAVTLPTGCQNYTLSFWKHIDTSEATSSAVDTLKVQLLNSSGTVLTTKLGLGAEGRAANQDAKALRGSAHLANQLKHIGHIEEHGSRDAEQIGALLLDGCQDAGVGRVGTQEGNVPAGFFEHIRHHVGANLVQLAGHSGYHCVTRSLGRACPAWRGSRERPSQTG